MSWREGVTKGLYGSINPCVYFMYHFLLFSLAATASVLLLTTENPAPAAIESLFKNFVAPSFANSDEFAAISALATVDDATKPATTTESNATAANTTTTRAAPRTRTATAPCARSETEPNLNGSTLVLPALNITVGSASLPASYSDDIGVYPNASDCIPWTRTVSESRIEAFGSYAEAVEAAPPTSAEVSLKLPSSDGDVRVSLGGELVFVGPALTLGRFDPCKNIDGADCDFARECNSQGSLFASTCIGTLELTELCFAFAFQRDGFARAVTIGSVPGGVGCTRVATGDWLGQNDELGPWSPATYSLKKKILESNDASSNPTTSTTTTTTNTNNNTNANNTTTTIRAATPANTTNTTVSLSVKVSLVGAQDPWLVMHDATDGMFNFPWAEGNEGLVAFPLSFALLLPFFTFSCARISAQLAKKKEPVSEDVDKPDSNDRGAGRKEKRKPKSRAYRAVRPPSPDASKSAALGAAQPMTGLATQAPSVAPPHSAISMPPPGHHPHGQGQGAPLRIMRASPQQSHGPPGWVGNGPNAPQGFAPGAPRPQAW
jgi:hypothetical protein